MPSNLRYNYLYDKNQTINNASYPQLCKAIIAEDIKIIYSTLSEYLVEDRDILYRTSQDYLKIKSQQKLLKY
ncbi:hypothetical protein NIES4102_23630 [Chondrocystis sp. NIES-4102]|nr:hypothetical protein NIES4102_23630 [Chondrocystis sp. NIES-4102]